MAVNKYLTNNAGVITEIIAPTTSAGAGDTGKIVALNASGVLDSTIVNSKTSSSGAGDTGKLVALDAAGRIDATMMPVGVSADTASITTSEAIAAGDFVNIWDSTGAKARKADATTNKPAHGFCLAGAGSGAALTVYFEGTNTSVTGQTPGSVFLSTTAGLATSTAPSGSGNIVQPIGFAISATAINFQSLTQVVLA
ncbi:MAG: hypothetical protein PHW53_04985 [Patescibacteria group bacterium]|nr:hypothetical protein [Patescibacteria group bacterium]